MQCRSRLEIWPGSSPANRAGSSLFTLSLAHVSALMSFHAEICGSITANGRMWLLLQGVCKPAKLILIPGVAGFTLYLLLQATWEPRQQSMPLTSSMGPDRRASSGKGTSEAAANILTLPKNFTSSCQISKFLIFSSPISFLTWMKP